MRRLGGAGVKRYRPHILVTVRSGHRPADRDAPGVAKCADRHAVWLVSAPGQRRHRPGRHRLAFDRQDRRLALAPAEACRVDRQAGKRRRERHRLRRRFQLAVEPGVRSGVRRRAAAGRRLGRAAGIQAMVGDTATNGQRRSTSTGRCRNSTQHAWSAIVNVAVEPDGLVRRYSFGEMLDGKFLPSVGALLAGKYESNEAPLRIDFSIRPDIPADGLLRRCAARRSRRHRKSSRTRRSSSARPRSSSATGSACRTAGSFPVRSCRCWRRNRFCRAACCALPPASSRSAGLASSRC